MSAAKSKTKKKKMKTKDKVLLTVSIVMIVLALLALAGVLLMNTSIFQDPNIGEGGMTNSFATPNEIKEKTYNELIYQNKMIHIRANIQKAEKQIKFWHKRDTKPNRGLCNQTIRGTRTKNGVIKKVNKLNIYNPSDVETLKKMIKNGKEDSFLMY